MSGKSGGGIILLAILIFIIVVSIYHIIDISEGPIRVKVENGYIYNGYFGSLLHLKHPGKFLTRSEHILYRDATTIMTSTDANITWIGYPRSKHAPQTYFLSGKTETSCSCVSKYSHNRITIEVSCDRKTYLSITHILFQLVNGNSTTTSDFSRRFRFNIVKKLIGYESPFSVKASYLVIPNQVYTYKISIMDKFRGKTIASQSLFLDSIHT